MSQLKLKKQTRVLEQHATRSFNGQYKLDGGLAHVALKKFLKAAWTPRAALLQLLGDLLGGITRPALADVEADDLDGVGILPLDEVAQQGLPIGVLLVGLGPNPAERMA